MLTSVVLVLLAYSALVFGKIPDDIKLCKVADLSCIKQTIEVILHTYPGGYPDLGLTNLEPLKLEALNISSRSNSARSSIQLSFAFKDIKIYGLSKSKVVSVVGFEENPKTSKFEVNALVPLMQFQAKYSTKGRVLLLPIVGDGDCEVNMINLTTRVKFKPMVKNEPNGVIRISVDKLKVYVEPQEIKLNFENLFNGNAQLGREMNKVINENWQDVWSELREGITNGFESVLGSLISEVFQKITYDEFYSKE